MKLGFRIAIRFLTASLGQTLLIMIGISVGVSVQIFIGSLIQGLQQSLLASTIGSSPHITIVSDTSKKEFSEYIDLADEIRSTDERIKTVTYVLDEPAFLLTEDTSQSLLIRGLPLSETEDIYHFQEALTEGRLPASSAEILLGSPLKEQYGLSVGDMITLLSTDNTALSCTITGFFDLKVASLNESWGIMSLSAAQQYFAFPDQVTGIELQLYDPYVFEADLVADKLQELPDFTSWQVQNWKVQNESLLSGLQGQSISSIMIQVFVMISVVLGIASVLAISVLQKSKQIGILKAMGMKNRLTSFIFLAQGAILGLGGALLGIMLGLALSFSFTKFAVTSDGSPVVALSIQPWFIILSGAIAVTASLAASLLPAIRSSRLNPIDIIRNS